VEDFIKRREGRFLKDEGGHRLSEMRGGIQTLPWFGPGHSKNPADDPVNTVGQGTDLGPDE